MSITKGLEVIGVALDVNETKWKTTIKTTTSTDKCKSV